MLGGIVGIVEQRVDGLVAFEIDDAEGLAAFDDMHEIVSGRHGLAVVRERGIERAFPEHQCPPARHPAWKMRLFSKPRIFSGADERHGSSANAGVPSKIS